jgi:hypothetical protein
MIGTPIICHAQPKEEAMKPKDIEAIQQIRDSPSCAPTTPPEGRLVVTPDVLANVAFLRRRVVRIAELRAVPSPAQLRYAKALGAPDKMLTTYSRQQRGAWIDREKKRESGDDPPKPKSSAPAPIYAPPKELPKPKDWRLKMSRQAGATRWV